MQLWSGGSIGVSGLRNPEPAELQELDDLREDDIDMACSNLGFDFDYREYFINRLAGA